MIDQAERTWARHLVRGNLRATVFLGLFAAVSAAASMSAWQYARRAESVVDRRVERFNPSDGMLATCPPGADPGVDLTPCLAFEPSSTAFDALLDAPSVVAATFTASVDVTVSATPDDVGLAVFSMSEVRGRGRLAIPHVVAGREVSGEATDEIVLNESAAAALGVAVGDEVWVAVCEFAYGMPPTECGDRSAMHLVGVVRSDRDLTPVRPPPPGLDLVERDFGATTSSAWFRDIGAPFVGFVQGTLRVVPGATLDDVRGEVEERLGEGWTVLVSPNDDATVFAGLRQSTRLQGRSLLAIAAILAVAGAVFVGQGLVRQLRRELADHPVAHALGMTRSQITAVAVLRTAAVAMVASVVAVVLTLVASGFGPTGLAGRADVDGRWYVDATVLGVGTLVVWAGLLAIAGSAAWRLTRVRTRRQVRVAPTAMAGVMSPPASAALVIGRSTRTGASVRGAVLGTAAAVVGAIVASVVVGSLDLVAREPERFGAGWEYAVGGFFAAGDLDAIAARAAEDPVITDASALLSSGPVELDGVPAFWVMSIEGLKGDLGSVIVDGRAPMADDEIAMAPSTLASLGLDIGDRFEGMPALVADGSAGDVELVGPFTVVGVALISDDARTVGPGKGVVVTEATRRRIDPAVSPMLVVRTDPSTSPRDAARHLMNEYGMVSVPSPQADVANLVQLRSTPWVIALLVGILAAAALGHALTTLVRRSRHEAGVLRSLGFTSDQLLRTVCWQATGVAALALAVGVPLGVVLGRWCWTLVAEQVGLATGPVVGLAVPLACVVGVVLVANAIAIPSGWRESRRPVAESLRAE